MTDSAAALTPDEVRSHTFDTVAGGGFAPDQVRAFLGRVAETLRQAGGGDGSAVQVLVAARRTADETISGAHVEAERLLADARRTAAAVEAEARDRAEGVLAGLVTRRDELESQVEELRAFEREYRIRLRAYLVQQLRELESEETFADAADSG